MPKYRVQVYRVVGEKEVLVEAGSITEAERLASLDDKPFGTVKESEVRSKAVVEVQHADKSLKMIGINIATYVGAFHQLYNTEAASALLRLAQKYNIPEQPIYKSNVKWVLSRIQSGRTVDMYIELAEAIANYGLLDMSVELIQLAEQLTNSGGECK